MKLQDIIEGLRTEAKDNEASKAAFHMFATRDRTRGNIVLSALARRMKQEGFNYAAPEYVRLVKLLAHLGLATISRSGTGRILGVNNLKFTLQSIGKAACGENSQLREFNARHRYQDLPEVQQVAVELVAPPVETTLRTDLKLEVDLDGTPVQVPLPKGLTVQQIATLINRLAG